MVDLVNEWNNALTSEEDEKGEVVKTALLQPIAVDSEATGTLSEEPVTVDLVAEATALKPANNGKTDKEIANEKAIALQNVYQNEELTGDALKRAIEAKNLFGMDILLGAANPKETRTKVHVDQTANFLKDYPRLASFLTDPTNNVITRGDLGALSNVVSRLEATRKSEQSTTILGQFDGFFEEAGLVINSMSRTVQRTAWETYTARLEEGELISPFFSAFNAYKLYNSYEISQAGENLSPERQKKLDALNASNLDQSSKEYMEKVASLEISQWEENIGYSSAIDKMNEEQKAEDIMRQLIRARIDPDSAGRYMRDGIMAIGQMVPSIVVTVVTKNPMLGAALMGVQVYGQRYDQAYARTGGNHLVASSEAGLFAAIELVTERIPLGSIIPNKLKGALTTGASVAKTTTLSAINKKVLDTLKTAGLESAQEIFVEAFDIGYGMGILDENMTMAEATRKLFDAGVIGFGVGGTMQLSGSALRASLEKLAGKPDLDALIHEQNLNDTQKAVHETTTIANSPETVKEFIDQESEATGDGTVFVNAEELLKLNQEEFVTDDFGNNQNVEAIPVDRNELIEAAKRGGDVEIKKSDLLTLDDAKFKKLSPYIRRTLDAPTPLEAKAQLEQRDQDIANLSEAMNEELRADPDATPVYDAVYNNLVDTGMDVAEADAQASLYQERYNARADRMTGVTAHELFLEDNVSIRKTAGRPSPEQQNRINTALEQRDTGIPSTKASGSTQRKITADAYPTIVKLAEKKIGKVINTVLDYGAGLGLGTTRMRQEGYNVHSLEPNTENWQGDRNATYTNSSQIKQKFDLVVSLNVLNVLEPDIRDLVLDDIIDKIGQGGSAVIGVRKWKDDVDRTTTGVPAEEGQAIKDIGPNKSYQRGWDGDQLLEYVQSRLPEGYSVVKIKAGKTGVLIRRNVPSQSQVTGQVLNQDDPNDTQDEVIAKITSIFGDDIEITEIDGIGDAKDIPIITLKDLIGAKIIATIADRTAIAGTFKGIGDTILSIAIPYLGGPYFPFRLSNRLKGYIWADRGKTVEAKKTNAIIDKGATHKIVMLGDPNMHISNVTINTMYFQVLLEKFLQQGITSAQLDFITKSLQDTTFKPTLNKKGEMTDASKKNAAMIEHIKSFKGFDSFSDGTNGKEVFDWLHSIPFEARKMVMKRMASQGFSVETGINVQEILNESRERSLNVQSRGMGVLVVKIAQNEDITDTFGAIEHPDFPLGMKGEVVGMLETPLSYKQLFAAFLKQKRYDKINPIYEDGPKKGQRNMGGGVEPTESQLYRSFEMSLPVVEVTEELVNEVGDISAPDIDGQIQAQAVLSMVNKDRTQYHYNLAKNKNGNPVGAQIGGPKVPDLVQAIEITKSSLVIPKMEIGALKAKLKMGLRGEVGGYLLSRIEPAHLYSVIEITERGNKIVTLINNEAGTEGFAYDTLILDALDRGATFAEVKEGTPEYSAFIDIGFKPDDDGVLVWKGEKTENESYSERYIRGGYANILDGRTPENVEAAVNEINVDSTEQFGSRARARLESIGRFETEVYDKTLSASARQIAISISNLSEAALRNLDLTVEDKTSVANIIDNPLPLYQDETAKISTSELLTELEIVQLPTDEVVLGVLGGFPNYLESVAAFINNQREKLVTGTLTVRDLVKAHAITVGSQGASAMKVKTFTDKTGFVPSAIFVDRGMIRPEEAVAMWFGTLNGQKALDALENGNLDPALWTELLAWRKAWGDNRLLNMGFLKSLADIADVTTEVNELGKMAGRGQNILEDINNQVKRLGGIGPAKSAFITHLLGLGDVVTMDAVEINFWLTGKADVKALKGKQKALVNATKNSEKGMSLLRDMVMARFQQMKNGNKLKIPDGVNNNVFMHVMHHWLWDRAKGVETTHAGLYEAMTMYQDGQSVDLFPEAKLEKRHSKYGVGKRMGPDVYMHKTYLKDLPADVRKTIETAKLPENFSYEIIKYNEKTGQVSLIESPDWNEISEPTTGDSFIIKPDGTTKLHKAPSDPVKRMVYHHKWLFVKDDYAGFDVAESRMRSRIWKALPNVDVRRIGQRQYWETQVIPRMTPNSLAQKDTSPVGPRGSFFQERIEYGNIANVIELTDKANMSTFLHETGHFFLFQMHKDLQDPRLTKEGREQLTKDLGTVRNWFRKSANEAWHHQQSMAKNARSASNKNPDDFKLKDKAQRLERAVEHAKANGGAKYMRAVADNFMTGKLPYATDLEIAYHEMWARGAEKYFGSGVAPTYALRGAYMRFSEWMVGVYKDLRHLNVDLDAEVSRVFDRLVTSADAVQNSVETDALMIPEDLKELATEAEYERLVKLAKTAQAQAREEVHTKVLALLKKEQSAQRKEQEASIKDEVTKEVRSRPIYAALNMIRRGLLPNGETVVNDANEVTPMQINREAFIENYGAEAARRLPHGTLTKKGAKDASGNPIGYNISVVATAAGFADADSMVAALSEPITPEKAMIDAETAQRVTKELDPILNDEVINEQAIEAVANDKQLEVLATQARLRRRLIKPDVSKIMSAKAIEEGAPPASVDTIAIASAKAEEASQTDPADPEAVSAQIEGVTTREAKEANIPQRKAQASAKRKLAEILRGVSLDVIKESARLHVQSLSLNLLNPNKFRMTADRLGKQYAKAIAGRDYQLAEDLLNQITLNIALAKEANNVKNAMVKKIGKLEQIINKSDKKLANTYDTDIINLMRSVLHTIQIGRPIATNAPLKQVLEKYKETDPAVHAELTTLLAEAGAIAGTVTEGKGKMYQRIPVDNLTEVVNLMNRLLQEARDIVSYDNYGEKIHRDQIISEFKSTSADISNTGKALGNRGSKSWRNRKTFVREFLASLSRIELWARWFDNNNNDGPMTKYIVRPVMNAVTEYNTNRVEPIKELALLIQSRGRDLYERINIVTTEFGGNWTLRTKGELIHMLLHTGNASNLRKMILAGQKDPVTGNKIEFGSEDAITGELDTSKFDAFIARMFEEGVLTKEDVDLVNGIWAIFDTKEIVSWNGEKVSIKQAAQNAHKEMHGYYFTELEASPSSTPFGTLTGGYVPAIFDQEMNTDVARNMTEDMLSTQGATGMFPKADAGFTKSRVEYNEPMALDLTMLPLHLDKVIRFAYIAPTVRKVGRLLLNKEIKAVIGSVDKSFLNSALLPWLQRSVTQRIAEQSGSKLDSAWRYLSRVTGAQTMAGNLINSAQQFTGLISAAVVVSPKFLVKAMGQHRGKGETQTTYIWSRSPYMRQRMSESQNDFQNQVEELLAGSENIVFDKLIKTRKWMNKHAYFVQQVAQNVIDPITWIAAEEQARTKGHVYDQTYSQYIGLGPEVAEQHAEEAVALYADRVVRDTQSPMAAQDISKIEAGTAGARLFVKFYSYFNNMYNLNRTEYGIAARAIGWKGKPSKYLYIYLTGIALPAIIAQGVAMAARGEFGDEEKEADQLLTDLFLWSQFDFVTGMVPYLDGVKATSSQKLFMMTNCRLVLPLVFMKVQLVMRRGP